MKIQLNQVIPAPLSGEYSEESIWGKTTELSGPSYYLVNAASGKGKSTLLSYIYGLRNDFSGHIRIQDKDVSVMTLREWSDLRKTRIAMMFQDLRLFDGLTALENINMKRQQTNTVSVDDMMRMTETMGVSGLLGKQVRFLSMGQQQRIALIRTLVQPFEYLLLDEPFSHVDKENIARAEQLIEEACKKNHAGLVVTTLGEKYGLNYHESIFV